MAVRPWELQHVDRSERPILTVVPISQAAPPTGRPGWAIAFVVVLILALAVPAAGSALFEPEQEIGLAQRPAPALEIMELDRLPGLPDTKRPKSSLPVVGYAFVRCTRLWTAFPDGSHERKIIEMAGISSPAFAPDARSIAFFVDHGAGQDLWVASADGSRSTRIGALASHGGAPAARATGLTWSPDGTQLALALVDDTYGELEGGSAIWLLDLTSGRFKKVGAGWPTPFWAGGKVAFSDYRAGEISFQGRTSRRIEVRSLRSDADDLAAAVVPDGWSGNWRRGVAVLSGDRRNQHLVIKDRYAGDARYEIGPPTGHRFEPHARPAIAQDASSVAIGLVDRSGERDLGVLDTRSQTWRVLDYAWEPTASTAPILTGTIQQQRALEAVGDLVNAWNLDGGIQRSLLAPDGDRSVIPVTERMIGLVTKTPVLNGREWLVPALVYGRAGHRRVFRAIDFTVSTQHGALRVMPTAAAPTHPLRTVADAVAFAASALDRDVPPPPLPSNTAFLPNSFQAWTSRGRSMVGFEVRLPGGSRGPGGPARMGFAYGAVSFMQGCGDSGAATKEIRLGTAPALLDSTDDMYQVIWPATIGDDRSIYSVSGFYVSQETVLASARDMEAATR